MTGAPLLSLQSVTAAYGSITALHSVSLDVPAGEIVTLIGANGAGKSTLMMTIFGNPRAREGHIIFNGRDITELPTHEIARLGLAQSPEGRRIFGRMTVEENLRMGAELPATAITMPSCDASLPYSRASRSACISVAARCRAASSRC
jgi:branched-chain amino acid transport system ATP-binding protein